MLKAGVHPKIVSERLGHANVLITLDTYSHVLPGMQETAVIRFEDLLGESNREACEKGNVSKMLAKNEDYDGEPPGYRTRDTLIKSYRVPILASKGVWLI